MTQPLRIAIDDSAAFNQGAGIGRYARNVVPRAAAYLSSSELTLWYAPSQPGPAPFLKETVDKFSNETAPRVRRGRFSRRRMDQLWYRARMPVPFRLLAGQSDIVYSPDFTAPPDGKTPRIVTVHDLAFLIRPEYAPAPLRRYLSAVVPAQVRGAARVVTVSHTTKTDVIARLGVDPSKITVVPNGVDNRFAAAAALSDAEQSALGLPRTYVLTVGTLEPRKNHLTLFASLEQLPPDLDLPLVVAGRKGWAYEPILAAAERLRAQGRVILLDYVPDRSLPRLYAGAAAFVYPSWYEGFGLPVLEAMATGVPVVASDVPALREVGGETVIYVDPSSPEALASGIEQALRGENQVEGARDGRRSRSQRFGWDDAGSRLASVWAEVADRTDLLHSMKVKAQR